MNRDNEAASSRIIWLCALTLLLLLIWAHVAVLDEVTTGSGKVTPSSRAQIIDNLDGGILKQLSVREGDIVRKGELLATLDPARYQSSYGEASARVRTLRATAERLDAELSDRPLQFSADIRRYPQLVARETQLYESRRQNLTTTLQNLQQSLKLVQAELNLTEPLVARGAAGKVEALRLRRQVSDLQGKIDEVHNDYAVRTHEEQVKNSAELDAQLQVAAGREDQLTRTALLSPVYGIVKAIAITTPGGVVEPGGKLMEIVPLEDRLLIETRVAPRDIAWIRAGLPATVKITAYDTAIYGDLPGIVESVSPDTLQDSDLREPPYFRVYVRTQTATLTSRRGQRFPVLPGMLADVEIKTGQKSVLDYLLKPLNKAAEALRER
ncbi:MULTISPECIES: HlyD family efflux transporter periplasmic adaptor subunit [Pantoea]|jgi:adhesin transport system membrane fusion protein|uniref:HlyD family efflux transporter periplasmic adaptor subunit n=1 Tax=Pantoea TaxID=53335 RepID=UPI0008FD410D|nr:MULTISPECIES: HlyD family efflux transporter periplasmic adaptor subunit [Pantoea]MCL9647540.1 HlyD family efflux transporter periplasmic adaptor subunit [Pantoea eucrina]OIX99129.1 secretion protein HlyD [Pantoea sp. Ae16]RAU32339.1 HlyD family efflux transporter periplasmic adaptor subunit [Pantoea sp. RIT 413]